MSKHTQCFVISFRLHISSTTNRGCQSLRNKTDYVLYYMQIIEEVKIVILRQYFANKRSILTSTFTIHSTRNVGTYPSHAYLHYKGMLRKTLKQFKGECVSKDKVEFILSNVCLNIKRFFK